MRMFDPELRAGDDSDRRPPSERFSAAIRIIFP